MKSAVVILILCLTACSTEQQPTTELTNQNASGNAVLDVAEALDTRKPEVTLK